MEFFRNCVWKGPTVRPSMDFKNRIVKDHFCPELKELVISCWSHRWQHRPSMAEVEGNLATFIESRINPDTTGFTSADVEDNSLRYNVKGSSPSK